MMNEEQPVIVGSALKVPAHVAIIMDGNNRWARRRGLPGAAGHKAGVDAVRGVLTAARDMGIRHLTLFAFSSENWGRPSAEVRALMVLLSAYLRSEVKQLHRDGVRLRFIGARDRFSSGLQRQIDKAEALTANNHAFQLVIAADYGGRWDIAQAARTLAEAVQRGELAPEQITAERLGQQVALADLPEPDLMIRTGGDQRISNFLLWQFAYTEFYFTPALWPDFDGAALQAAVQEFTSRDRRFGLRNESSEYLVEKS